MTQTIQEKLPSKAREHTFVVHALKYRNLPQFASVLDAEHAAAHGGRPAARGFILNRTTPDLPDVNDTYTYALEHGLNLTLSEFVDLVVDYLHGDPIGALALVNYQLSRPCGNEFLEVVTTRELVPAAVLEQLSASAITILAPQLLKLGLDENAILAAAASAALAEVSRRMDSQAWRNSSPAPANSKFQPAQIASATGSRAFYANLDPRSIAHQIAISACELKASTTPANGPGAFCARRARIEKIRLSAGVPSDPQAAWPEPVQAPALV